MAFFRKKPVVIEAYQYCGGFPVSHWPDWLRGPHVDLEGPSLLIRTLEGTMRADFGDWIIKGIKGELYPCKPDIFEATYEAADAPSPQATETPHE